MTVTALERANERFRDLLWRDYATVSRSGHDCRLPQWIQVPNARDPRTGENAKPGLLVNCKCGAQWIVKEVRRHYDDKRPGLIWHQRRFRRAGGVDFDPDVAWAKPDPLSVDWDAGKPRRPNGTNWWQLDFPELLGSGNDLCSSTNTYGYAPPGGRMNRYTDRCLLKANHKGGHEAFGKHGLPRGWH